MTRNDALIGELRCQLARTAQFQRLLSESLDVTGLAVEARALVLATLQNQTRKRVAIIVPGDGQNLWASCHRDDVGRAFAAAAGNMATVGNRRAVVAE